MTFEVRLHPRVDSVLEKLEHQIAQRIRKKLRLLQDDPFRFLEHHGGDDVFKLRIGEYRALIDVDRKKQIVFVRHLDHRRRIYKKR